VQQSNVRKYGLKPLRGSPRLEPEVIRKGRHLQPPEVMKPGLPGQSSQVVGAALVARQKTPDLSGVIQSGRQDGY
jgi:hypothetical protein